MRKFSPFPLLNNLFQFLNAQQIYKKCANTTLMFFYCVDKSPTKIQPPKGWGIEASTPQSRRRKIAMRSWTACTAAAEYCEKPQQKLMVVLLPIAHKKTTVAFFKLMWFCKIIPLILCAFK
jgi:hypothetical protein